MAKRKKRIPWNTTTPPKRTQKPVRLRYKDGQGKTFTGFFVWCKTEDTWVEVCDHPDGIGLYADDGYTVLGWKDEPLPKSAFVDRSGLGMGGSGAFFD